ncbi:MAG: superinfection immunity protein [Nitrospira sp.]
MDDDLVTDLYVVGTAFLYCIPSFVALGRGHRNCITILVVNLSLGWTVVGWVGALVWSLTSRQRERES